MNTLSHVPPGFRFHPTEEELVDYYLRKQIATLDIDLSVIKVVDLYNIEPWNLQEICTIGNEDQNEWYFFSHKDKKYPTGTRTNRATKAGFWKATGRDKAIYSKYSLVGMRKTLVFYQGRAPNGQKSDWIMHEYRLETSENAIPQEEGWVVCRAFKKRLTTASKLCDDVSSCWYNDQVSFTSNTDPTNFHNENNYPYNNDELFLQLPALESPKLPQTSVNIASSSMIASHGYNSNFMRSSHNRDRMYESNINETSDWRALDKFVASQLSQDTHGQLGASLECASTSTSKMQLN